MNLVFIITLVLIVILVPIVTALPILFSIAILTLTLFITVMSIVVVTDIIVPAVTIFAIRVFIIKRPRYLLILLLLPLIVIRTIYELICLRVGWFNSIRGVVSVPSYELLMLRAEHLPIRQVPRFWILEYPRLNRASWR